MIKQESRIKWPDTSKQTADRRKEVIEEAKRLKISRNEHFKEVDDDSMH